MSNADHLMPREVDRSTILADSGQVKSESSIPEWVAKLPKRQRTLTNRALEVLATVAHEGPVSEYRVVTRSREARTSVRRSLKLLEERRLVSYALGKREAKFYDITNLGLFYCFLQHYLTSKEFVRCVANRSKLVSILLSTGNVALEKVIDETAKLTWGMAYSESVRSTLDELRIVKSNHETESAEDAHYFEMLRGVGSVEALEWTLITSVLELVGARNLKQALQGLSGEERAEIKKKLVEVRDSYGSAVSYLKSIVRVLDKTIRVFDDI